ncbi:ATP-grasp domain-containing protein [Clostridium intestinale]|uniref:ATP-grasp domain-containing protein n=1 Tax=Clostridium intestinale TaxID=36845 RepID=UPI0028E3E168|nr:ATP-grasp domain-containing protein [Clostridium intestinale]
MNFDKVINSLSNTINRSIKSLEIVIVAHVLTPRGHDNPIQLNCSETEHFTIQEFNEIYQGVVSAGFFIKKIFFTEFDFMKDVTSSYHEYTSTIVFNLCRNGKGMNKKTIVPAICDLLGIMYTSSNAGSCALARNKLLFTSLLAASGVLCPATSLDPKDLMKNLSDDTKVILKPNGESASQGIGDKSILKLKEATLLNSENFLVQEYIDGYECEVPIFCVRNKCFAMPPVGISFDKGELTGIISYESSLNYSYGFYPLSDVLSEKICKEIMRDAEKTFRLLGLERYGRVDFRIDFATKKHYVMDISTTPYLTKHSSFAFSVNHCKGNYDDIYKLIFASTLQ